MLQSATSARGSVQDFTMGDWYVQPTQNRVRRRDTVVRIKPQVMDVLVCLASHAGQTVSKDDILDTVWPGQYVVESGLARCVAELRHALGDAPRASRYIETIPKRGYRLLAPVTMAGGASLAVEPAADHEAPGSHWDEPPAAEVMGEPEPATVPVEVHGVPPADVPAFGLRRALTIGFAAGALVVGIALLGWLLFLPSTAADRDAVVLAFDNRTGDAVFDDALRMAVHVQLEESPQLRIVSEDRVRGTLVHMQRPADAPITRTVALDVCQRLGAKAVVAASLTPMGQRFVIGLEGVGCRSGDVIVRQQVEVERREAVLSGTRLAVSSIQRKLNATLAAMRDEVAPPAT
jgi:DNA-binding winged helix-turn-helix (wHTH) protein